MNKTPLLVVDEAVTRYDGDDDDASHVTYRRHRLRIVYALAALAVVSVGVVVCSSLVTHIPPGSQAAELGRAKSPHNDTKDYALHFGTARGRARQHTDYTVRRRKSTSA